MLPVSKQITKPRKKIRGQKEPTITYQFIENTEALNRAFDIL